LGTKKEQSRPEIITMKYLQVKNLEKYQSGAEDKHWIKIWKKIRSDWAIKQLTDTEKWYYIGLIMLATDCDNYIPHDTSYIASEVAQEHSHRLSKVRSGVVKMLDLGLLLLCDFDIRKEKKREEKSISSSKKLKPTYKGMEMRKQGGKWFVIPLDGGKWLEFGGKEKDIEYKI
jgi:hypothetical protein